MRASPLVPSPPAPDFVVSANIFDWLIIKYRKKCGLFNRPVETIENINGKINNILISKPGAWISKPGL